MQDTLTVTFDVTGANAGNLTMADIANVMPYFGTDGAPLIPEPASAIVWSLLGLCGTVACLWRRNKK